MKIIHTIEQMREALQKHNTNQSIALVPTMGALHQGHLSLVEKAKKENDIVVVSIFVNPTQFNNALDLEKYPKTLEKDVSLLDQSKVNYLFIPSVNEMYPDSHTLTFSTGYLDATMEGLNRPGHFSGVIQIIIKLFNIITPHNAYFGQKDIQQLAVIKRLTTELCFNTQIISCSIIREANGLAMSSRNKRLNLEEKETASNVYKSLILIKKDLNNSVNPKDVITKVTALLTLQKISVEYIEIVDAVFLTPLKNTTEKIAICIACHLGEVRLIDNIIFTRE